MRVTNLPVRIAKQLGYVMKKSKNATGIIFLAGGIIVSGADAQQLVGWTEDKTSTPADGPVEFYGFTFHDKDAWIGTAGDQSRSSFTKGSGVVVVADADEYDDLGDIGDNLFNVFLMTPELPLDGTSGDVAINFDSSFRPYDTMTGLVDVSFDSGASWDNLLTLVKSDPDFPNSSLDRIDEAVALTVANPGSGSVQVRFGMTEAGNDWWWAFDNVAVSAGATSLLSENFDDIPLSPYVSSSENTALTGWANLESAQVPEPAALGLAGIGAAFFSFFRRRRRKND